jgi:hypothetical protein
MIACYKVYFAFCAVKHKHSALRSIDSHDSSLQLTHVIVQVVNDISTFQTCDSTFLQSDKCTVSHVLGKLCFL